MTFLRITLSAVVLTLSASAAVAGVFHNADPPEYLLKWSERAAKSATLNRSPGAKDRLVKDLDRQLSLIKVEDADVSVDAEGDRVTIEISLRYDRPERTIVDRVYDEWGLVVGYTERIDYGWRVHVVAEKGKLKTNKANYVSEFKSYGHAQ